MPAGPPPSSASSPGVPGAPGATRLLLRPDDVSGLTANRETDARSALVRGLAEYLSQVSIEVPGGRRSLFKKVLETHAEPEELAEYPSAIVDATGTGTYTERLTTGSSGSARIAEPDGRFFLTGAEFKTQMTVDVWATDPKERMALSMAVEDSMMPVDWMSGMRLELPHYFNCRADYQLVSMSYLDSTDDAMRRYRRVQYVVTASIPVLRLVKLPVSKMRAEVSVVEENI